MKIIFIILFCLCSTVQAAKWDVQYWQLLEWNQWKQSRCRLFGVGETRLQHDLRHFNYYRLTQGFAFRALEDLDLEIHYSYVNVKTSGATAFSNRSRLEIEVNPFWTLAHGIQIHWRNRMDFIKQQNRLHIQYVLRERLKVTFSTEGEWIKTVSIANELFYDLSTKRFTQNRFYPLMLNFALGKEVSLDLFIMLRTHFSSNKWYREGVMGSQISF